ncbi:MAG: thioredoxin family protein [Candidatus Delongbacteria bacterium]|nr:thioredoxin family protein [Candidatus Delongbacteria bacterium]
MEIKVLGSGCKKCNVLEANVRKAIESFDEDIKVTKVSEIGEIMSYNVLITPCLVINEMLVTSGKVSTVEEIIEMIKEKLND